MKDYYDLIMKNKNLSASNISSRLKTIGEGNMQQGLNNVFCDGILTGISCCICAVVCFKSGITLCKNIYKIHKNKKNYNNENKVQIMNI